MPHSDFEHDEIASPASLDGGCAPPQELMTDADLWADMKKPSRRRFYRGLRADTNNMIT